MKKLTISISMIWMFLFWVTISAQNFTDYLTVNQKEAFTKVIKEQNPKLYDRLFNTELQIENNNTRVIKLVNENANALTQILGEKWENENWVNESKTTFTNDANGNITEQLSQNWENETWVNFFVK